MRMTTSDGVGLAVEVAGAGPGLLLVHGFGGAKEDFADHVAALARDNTVVIFDHRGHGTSDKPADRAAYSIDRLATDILEVADACGLDRFRLLGHSMGGMVGRQVPLREPARVEALVMMDTSAGPIPGFDPALMDAAAEVAFTRGKDALKELLDLAQVLETPAYQRTLVDRPGYREFTERKWADLSEVMWGAMAIALAHQPDDLAALAATVHVPTLILVGSQDTPFLAPSQEMADAIDGAQLVVVPDAGHSPQFENPGAWIEAMTRFLASVPTPAK
ncbi:MAG TPA: alpha/beta hydrolase [Acidimicrobiia bacterium]|nr:alpha/beta hydrolase [Acidimicrobiia bacterium]